MEDGRSSLPIAPSTPGGPFGAPIARRVQQLNGAGASKRAKHPLATSFHLPALETPSRPSNGIPSSSKSLEDPTETTLVSADNARWSLSMLAAGVCHQAGFEHVTGGALAELTTELERYLLDTFDTARSLSESCGRRRTQVRDLLEVLLTEGSSRAIYVEEKAKEESVPVDGQIFQIDLDRTGYVGLGMGKLKARIASRKADELDVVARMRRVMRTWTRRRKQGRRAVSPHVLGFERIPPSPPRPAMILLPSDEAASSSASSQKSTDRRLALAEGLECVPELPPRHTWKRTRVDPGDKAAAKNKASAAAGDDSAVAGRLSDSALDYLFHAVSMRSGATLAPELDVVAYHRTARAKDKDADRSRAKATAYAEALRRAAEDGHDGSSATAAAMAGLRAKRRLNAAQQHGQRRRWIVPGLEQKRVIRLKVAARSAK